MNGEEVFVPWLETKNLPNTLSAMENLEWLELSFWTVSRKTKLQNSWKTGGKRCYFGTICAHP